MKIMSLFETLTQAKLKDCIFDERIIFIVEENQIGKAIGKNGVNVRKIESALNKKVKIVWEGDEEGLLIALYDKDGSFLGIGMIEELDYERQVLKVYTNVKKGIVSIHVGQVKLDKSGKELEQSSAFADYT